MKNPIQQRIQADAIKKAAQSFFGTENFSNYAVLCAILFFLAAGWLPDAVGNLFFPDGNRLNGMIQIFFSLGIFGMFAGYLQKEIRQVERIKVLATVPASVRVLVIFLSNLPPAVLGNIRASLEDETISPDMLVGKNWEMPLLAVKHHAERLEKLYVFTSSEETGSHQQFPLFRQILNRFYPELQIEEVTSEGINFEEIDLVHNRLDKLYDELDGKKEYGPNDILVDITGGQKTNSIAGAMTTLAEGRKFQYVSTKNKEKVLCYDLIVEKAEIEQTAD